jgi:hypothetical protein
LQALPMLGGHGFTPHSSSQASPQTSPHSSNNRYILSHHIINNMFNADDIGKPNDQVLCSGEVCYCT